ncbi:MAC/Perforin domain-containing protein [Hirsutella rhossiliensis]|uniref:MAC/Perforin domain-containing protein n=1 Tax=Hirsutella rhossiliensis TaxID=111463 RepID=A0A9P8MS54_9HYPO|nr:MAC/Perforin domain-containing protein [Hirsutella rhossiliensis]KAH0959474.1 MAC/Perforin domain-containing protein [Hirsutella rhossiliensis]
MGTETADSTANAAKAVEESVTTIVHFTDGVKEREAFYLKLLKSSLDDEKLSDLRSNIAGLTGSIEISHFPFCGKKGAIVPDSFSVQEYLTECLGINTTEAKSLYVYMKDESLATELDSLTGANVGAVVDADKLARIKNQVDDVAFKYLTGTAAKYVPELEQKDWAVISESNALCYGIRVIRAKSKQAAESSAATETTTEPSSQDNRGVPVGIERARFPAFSLKKRTIMSDSIPSSAIEGVKLDLRIPDFIIDDKSYVSIYETETEMQSSMAASSFSEVDVAAAGGGSYMGFSGEASMSFAAASSQAASSSTGKKSKKATDTIEFPRVTLFLDSRSLELTPECEDALRKVKTKEDLYKFQDIYGEFFSSRVQLGGRLFATEDVTEDTATSSKEVARSMKLAASASFSGWGASASMSASLAAGGNASKQESSKSSSVSLTWQANGGDTLLCNKPTDWAPTVSYHWNWRITKQDNVFGLLNVMSQINGMDWLTAEAAKWGVTINPIDEAATMKATVAAISAKTFTLNAAGVTGGRYLLTFPYTACNLSATANARNAAGKNSFSINPKIHSLGCALLGPKTAKSKEDLRLYVVEDTTGTPVNEVKYNTKYRLRNRESGLYVSYIWEQYFRFVYSNVTRSNTRFIAFKDPKGSTSMDAIPDGSTVHVRFYEYKDDEVLGYLFVCAQDKDYAYLAASKPEAKDKDEAGHQV